MIKAECHSDDRCVEVDFDATPWFEKASEKEVMSLFRCGWRGDYPSDAVAHFMADLNESIAEMFLYLGIRAKKEEIGFECSVNEEDAMIWLKANRVAWWASIVEKLGVER
jgi:hypothetical protein